LVIRGKRADLEAVSALGEQGLVRADGEFEIKIPPRTLRAGLREIEVTGTAGKQPFTQTVPLPAFDVMLHPSPIEAPPMQATLEPEKWRRESLDARFDGGDVVFELESCAGVQVTSNQATVRVDNAKVEVRIPARKLLRLDAIELKVANAQSYKITLDAKQRTQLAPAYVVGFPASPIAEAAALGDKRGWVMAVKTEADASRAPSPGLTTDVSGPLGEATVAFVGTRVITRDDDCMYGRGSPVQRERHVFHLTAHELKTGRKLDSATHVATIECPYTIKSDETNQTLVPPAPTEKLSEWASRLKP
jgi:hypothetical protein